MGNKNGNEKVLKTEKTEFLLPRVRGQGNLDQWFHCCQPEKLREKTQASAWRKVNQGVKNWVRVMIQEKQQPRREPSLGAVFPLGSFASSRGKGWKAVPLTEERDFEDTDWSSRFTTVGLGVGTDNPPCSELEPKGIYLKSKGKSEIEPYKDYSVKFD